MVFAPTSEAAQACASPIRNVLWGAHKVAVLLPKGEEPIKVDFCLLAFCRCLLLLGSWLTAQRHLPSCRMLTQAAMVLCSRSMCQEPHSFPSRCLQWANARQCAQLVVAAQHANHSCLHMLHMYSKHINVSTDCCFARLSIHR